MQSSRGAVRIEVRLFAMSFEGIEREVEEFGEITRIRHNANCILRGSLRSHRSHLDELCNGLLTVLAGITYFLIYKFSIASMNSDEFINDPRHPRFSNGGKFIDLEKTD